MLLPNECYQINSTSKMQFTLCFSLSFFLQLVTILAGSIGPRAHLQPEMAHIANAQNKSEDPLNTDSLPHPEIKSTVMRTALTKALSLNVTKALSRLHPNNTWKNNWELPEFEYKNSTGSSKCYWPQVGQRWQIQKYKTFTSRSSQSTLEFWFSNSNPGPGGTYQKCNTAVPPGWNVLQPYILWECLNESIAFELRDTDTLVLRQGIDCKG